MPTIRLRRMKATTPDEGRVLTLVWEDRANPLIDESGNIIYTSKFNEAGNLIPAYPEFAVNVALPYSLPADQTELQALVIGLKDQALESAKIAAQKRANDLSDKNKIRSIVTLLNSERGIDFNGEVDLTGQQP